MSCYITCMVGASLLGGTISSMIYNKNEKSKVLTNTLNAEQLEIYNKIVKERMNHYIQGNILGLVLAIIYYLNSGNFDKKINICAFVLIAMSTTYFYYTLKPKTDYILKHLNNQDQINAWLSKYIEMKHRYIIGYLIGGLGYLLLSYGLYSFGQ